VVGVALRPAIAEASPDSIPPLAPMPSPLSSNRSPSSARLSSAAVAPLCPAAAALAKLRQE
jgi:hypothetical protein